MSLEGLYFGDCLMLLDAVPSGAVDLVLADLPYGTTANKWDSVLPLDELWTELLRVGKPNAAFVFTASQPFTSALVMSRPDLFRHEWIWLKSKGSNFANTVREPFKEHESVLVFSRGKWTYNKQMQPRTGSGADRAKYDVKIDTGSTNYRNFERTGRRTISELRVPSSWQKFNNEKGLHPTQKPVTLFKYLIETYSNPGDLVFDPCAGSGTTAVAAKESGRRFVCFEQDPNYFRTAIERVGAINASRQ